MPACICRGGTREVEIAIGEGGGRQWPPAWSRDAVAGEPVGLCLPHPPVAPCKQAPCPHLSAGASHWLNQALGWDTAVLGGWCQRVFMVASGPQRVPGFVCPSVRGSVGGRSPTWGSTLQLLPPRVGVVCESPLPPAEA